MEDKIIKTVTIGAIIVGIYLLLKGMYSANIPGASVPAQRPGFCNLKAQPMESSTCAIPLASDYIVCNCTHTAATSTVAKLPPLVQPIGVQTVPRAVPPPTSNPAPVAQPRVGSCYLAYKTSVSGGLKAQASTQAMRNDRLAFVEGTSCYCCHCVGGSCSIFMGAGSNF
jgi:hypothetical protein